MGSFQKVVKLLFESTKIYNFIYLKITVSFKEFLKPPNLNLDIFYEPSPFHSNIIIIN